MKYLWLTIFVVLYYPSIGQVGYGPEAGIGLSTYKFAPSTYPIDYTSGTASAIFSWRLGADIDVPLNKHIYFQAGLFLSQKGGQKNFSYYRNDSFNESVTQTLEVYYAEAPLSVVFKTREQGKGRIIFGVGVTPSYIIGGRNHLQDDGKFNDTSISSSGIYAVKRGRTLHGFDIGVNVSAGYELPTGLFFRAWLTSGVNDIGIGTELDKNRVYGISAGYFFGKDRNVNKDVEDLIDKGE